ncbi:MAG: GIY-YIG nuclease family protein [Betaproteobacteria bacterium]|jgi:putative endonuclease
MPVMPENSWWVYIVRCADGSLYTGIARDLDRRIAAHNGVGAAGASYTRARRPVRLVYREGAANRSAASRREYEIKQLTREDKLALVLRSGAAAGEGEDQQ